MNNREIQIYSPALSSMIKNLKDAKRYVNEIKSSLVEDPFNSRDWADTLKFLAEDKDEEGFRIVVEAVCYAIRTTKNLKLYAKEPLALIESFLRVLDHPIKANYHMWQIYRGVKIKRPPIGKTQKFFQKIYGSHFFKK